MVVFFLDGFKLLLDGIIMLEELLDTFLVIFGYFFHKVFMGENEADDIFFHVLYIFFIVFEEVIL